MELKILHTGDLHIGMKFANYPEGIRGELVEARFKALDRLVGIANNENCNLFVVAGDMFDNTKVAKRDIDRVIRSLGEFQGECVLVMPGNHDYDNGMVELWERFENSATEGIVLLNEKRSYSLKDYGIDAVVYPGYCHTKHSSENCLGWIRELKEREESKWNLGVAHGSLEGLSPDMGKEYFPMTLNELQDLSVDAWFLGHTHISYPEPREVVNHRIFNAGTPEPDGIDCSHGGCAWLVSLNENKEIKAREITTGEYRFIDVECEVRDEESLDKIKKEFLMENPETKLLRLTLKGRINQEIYGCRQDFYREFADKLAYFKVIDSGLGIKITKDDINKEFTQGSFPHKLLSEISDDEEALQLAYEIIRGVK